MISQITNKLSYKHPTAIVYGKVTIGDNSSLWTYSVIRSEMNEVIIGEYTNIQDFVMIHVGDKLPTIIGDYCTIAHRAVIHGANIGNNCLVGVGSILMDGCKIGENTIIGAGVYLPPNTIVPANSIVSGNPGVVVKKRNNYIANRFNALMYFHNAKQYSIGNYRGWDGVEFKKESKAMFRRLSEEYKLLT